MSEDFNSGNWVSKNTIIVPAIIALIFVLLSPIYPPFALPGAFCILLAIYFAYARHLFSPHGGNIQNRIYDLLLEKVVWDGRGQAIDIGCGNANLCIKLALKYRDAAVIGVDTWGARWGYSKAACEKNSTIAGVSTRVTFQKASASSLPFDDGAFDLAISNLTFHEVVDFKNKRDLIKEGLRVLKTGGTFVFQDLFLSRSIYGDPEALLADIRGWGIKRVELIKTRDAVFIPRALKPRFMVGTMAIIRGEK